MNMKRIIAFLLALLTAAGTLPALHAQAADELLASMVRIEAREDFAFRYDLSNKGEGEASPISQAYYLSAYKVTNEQYAKFVAETGHKTPNYWKNGTYPQGKGKHPVLNVSYSDAVQYCEWISARYDGWTFRLPTEAEWENAAMGKYYGDTAVKYPNGRQTPAYDETTGVLTAPFNYNGVIAAKLFAEYGKDHVVQYVKGDFVGQSETLGECISISKTGGVSNWANHGGTAQRGYFLQTDLYASVSAEGGHTTEVGTYAPNSLGLYDMAGNAWDLTSSVIVAANGLEKGVSCYAVRGGSWYATARSCTFHYRGEGRKDSPSSTVGFRLAADYAPAEAAQNNKIVLTIGNKEALVFGETVQNDVAPLLQNGRTMLPARFVAEKLGADVKWDDAAKKVTVTKGETEIVLYVGSEKAYVNGEERLLDSPAFIQDGRTYSPMRFICENLGADVKWNAEKKQAIITKNDA